MCVTISLRGENLDPNDITSYLNRKPSFSFRKGDKFKSGKDKIKIESKFRNYGAWIYYSADSVDSEDVNEHLSHIVKVLQQSKMHICDDDKVELAEIDVFLSLEVSDGKSNMGNLRLAKDSLFLLQQQGLELVVSYDAYCEPE